MSELGISERSVRRIAKVDLNLASFRCIPAQVLLVSVKQKRLDRCKQMVSAAVCFGRKGKLYFVAEKGKVSTKH